MNRRDALKALLASLLPARAADGASPMVSTIIGTGVPGYSDAQVSNPYGLAFGPDGALYFCDLDNQRVRRLEPGTRRTTTVAGNGQQGYSGDGGAATAAPLNMPHEVQVDAAGHLYVVERDSHVVRRIDAKTGLISTLAGTGRAGCSGDGGPAARAELRQPHSIALAAGGRHLLVCDTGNHRVRLVDLATGVIDTIGGTGATGQTRDGVPFRGSTLHGPRALAFDRDGDLYLALREGNAICRIDARHRTIHRFAGTGETGYAGDGGPAAAARFAGPKGLAWSSGFLYVADTENHVIRRIDLATSLVDTVLGTGRRGDGPGPEPRSCALSRPHGVLVDRRGVLYVADSEAHRIRTVG